MNISFHEYIPALILQPYIETYWKGNFNLNRNVDFQQNVIPNGCIELIIHLTNHHCALNKEGESYHKSPPFTLIGMYDKPYIVKFSEKVQVFAIRFYPDGFRNIFGVPPSEFLSTYEDGINVVGKRLYDFCAYLKDVETPDNKVKQANEFFIEQLSENRKEYDITHMAMELIRQKQGLMDFKELTDRIPISLRQLQREFKNHYKVKITDYIRVTRLNAINKYMLGTSSNLTELAYHLDFTDQSHFIREFKHYTGVSPKQFLKEKTSFLVNTI